MQYRPLEKDDVLQQAYINGMSFFFPVDKAAVEKRLEEGDDHYKHWIGAFEDDGQMIACFCVNPYDLWFDGHIVGMGGIGGVATLVEHRRRGAIRGIFDYSLKDMYDRGMVFSALYPFSYEYYRMFGYDVGMTGISIKGALKPLLKFPMAPVVKPFNPEDTIIGEPSDPEDIVNIYNQWAPKYNMAIDREGFHWRRRLEKEPTASRQRVFVNYEQDGTPASYIMFRRNDDGDLEVLDTAWVNRQGLYYILGLLGRMDGNLGKLVWTLPDGVTPELLYKHGNLYEIDEVKRRFTGMNRIINVEKALGLMKRPLVRGQATIRVTDPQLPQNDGTYRITSDGKGGGDVTRLKTRSADLECDIQGLMRLVTGYEEIDQAQWEPNVQIRGKEDFLRALFPKKLICMNEYF